MPSDFSDLIPVGVASDLVAAITTQSVALTLGRRQPMPTGVEIVPVVESQPTAEFVAAGGRKPASKIEWTAEHLRAEEVATTLSIPDSFLDDAGYPVWNAVRPSVASGIAKAIDEAVLYGVGAPPSFPTGGVAALAGAALSGGDALSALDAAFAKVEGQGLPVTGIAAGVQIATALRQAYRAAAALPSVTPEQTVYGVPVAVTPIWDSSKGDALVGDWQLLLVGVRTDLRFETSTDGVLLDADGQIITSAFQDDVTLLRAFMRIGCVIGRPVAPDGSGPVDPFAFASWTAATPGAASKTKS
jgi:hypothetical protein